MEQVICQTSEREKQQLFQWVTRFRWMGYARGVGERLSAGGAVRSMKPFEFTAGFRNDSLSGRDGQPFPKGTRSPVRFELTVEREHDDPFADLRINVCK